MRPCQIALSTTDLLRTHHWYRRALGFLGAGKLRHLEEPGRAAVPDLPELSLDVLCLVEQQDLFQLELIEFQRPRTRPVPADWRPCDIGYTMIGLHVVDFDHALDRLARTSGRLLTAPMGDRGHRRVCLRDPNGVLLELMEDDVRPATTPATGARTAPVTTQSITLSVFDLERAIRFWTMVGFSERRGLTLHAPEHETLWGLEGAERESLVMAAGNLLLELVVYERPRRRARPAGYLISDQGILNVAVGSSDKSAFDALHRRLIDAGYRANSEPWTLPGTATVVYFTDDQGFSVELLHVAPAGRAFMGFVATGQ